jgi:ectoine hydroxylase-related dioxygenase (phytanoyl-CoA dioxygenase family)
MPRTFMAAEAKRFPEGSLAELPDIEASRDKYRILGWELQPGDAVCFHMLMLHGARGVTGAERRRVFSVRFLGDDIRHAPRRWKTSPDFPGLADELAPGAPMNHPLFPVLWSSQP